VALERQVPLDHLLYRILKTHFRYTLDVNFKARTALINSGGLFDQFIGTGGIHAGHLQYMVKTYSEWTFEKMCLPDDLRSRGFEKDPLDPDFELPGYLYAKDASVLWKGIDEYCEDVVDAYYKSDDDFRSDLIARNYFLEVQKEGFPDIPTLIPTSKKGLARILTGVIFTAVVQHSAVNFAQFAHYGFVANSPLAVTKPAPQPGDRCDLRDFLPGTVESGKAIATVWGLSRFVEDDERYIFSHDHHFFNLSLWNDPKYQPICVQLQAHLEGLESQILNRGRSAYGTKYLWLLPSMLPTSIAS